MGSYDRNFLTDEPKKQRVDTYDTVYRTLHLASISKMSKDKFNVKRALWNANEERPSQESRIFDSKIHHPPSQKIYPIFLHRTSHVSRLKSSCLRNRDKKVALTVARGKTRWLAKTNVQSPSKKIQYPTSLKKGGERKKRETKEEKGSSPPMLKIERLNNDTRY